MPDTTMDFPTTWEQFLDEYSFKDKEEYYTNGLDLIPTCRVEQMVQHYFENHETQKVELLNYKGEKITVDIGELKDIYLVEMNVISGDECLTVFYKDGSVNYFDADKGTRTECYDDGGYLVYMPGVKNLFKNKRWVDRSLYDTGWDED